MTRVESFNTEYKQKLSRTFLKTVSAYANYGDGEIFFGIDDAGRSVGITEVDENCIKIENMINDSIQPVPEYSLRIITENDKQIIALAVKKGKDTPYYYNGKAYRRSDTATIEVDRFELRRLALEGLSISFEEQKASTQSLTFHTLETKLRGIAGIKKITADILKTLNLYSVDGTYNIAAELLADNGQIRFSGIDVLRFGATINTINYRETIRNVSLLAQYDRAMALFEQYYQYEEIQGYLRKPMQLIPKDAFREALANALTHRVWDINSFIQIAMYDDRIVITSPGGLPRGLSEDEYRYNNISVMRNPIIASVLHRLQIIEHFGTGIARIIDEYQSSFSQPEFTLRENSIEVSLPVVKTELPEMTKEAQVLYNHLKRAGSLSRAELDERTSFDKSKTLRIINSLLDRQVIKRHGNGPATRYSV